MNPSYYPREGTVAYRIVAWLETQPQGASFLGSRVSEAVNYPPKQLTAALAPAVEAGLIEAAPPHGQQRPLLYRLAPERHPDAGRKPPRGKAAEVAPVEVLPAIAQPDEQLSETTLTSPLVTPSRTPRRTNGHAQEVRSMRLGLWSDGTLHIERLGSAPLVLPPSEANALRRFLATINTMPTP